MNFIPLFIFHILAIFSSVGAIVASILLYIKLKQNGAIYICSGVILSSIMYGIGVYEVIKNRIVPLEGILFVEITEYSLSLTHLILMIFLLPLSVLIVVSIQKLLKTEICKKHIISYYIYWTIIALLIIGNLVNPGTELISKFILLGYFTVYHLPFFYFCVLSFYSNLVHDPFLKESLKIASVFIYPILFLEETFMIFEFIPEYEIFDIFYYLFFTTVVFITAIRKLNNQASFNNMDFSNFTHKYKLTERESEVIKELLKGGSYKGIGEQLYISTETVKSHVSNILRKTNVKASQELKYLIKTENMDFTKY